MAQRGGRTPAPCIEAALHASSPKRRRLPAGSAASSPAGCPPQGSCPGRCQGRRAPPLGPPAVPAGEKGTGSHMSAAGLFGGATASVPAPRSSGRRRQGTRLGQGAEAAQARSRLAAELALAGAVGGVGLQQRRRLLPATPHLRLQLAAGQQPSVRPTGCKQRRRKEGHRRPNRPTAGRRPPLQAHRHVAPALLRHLVALPRVPRVAQQLAEDAAVGVQHQGVEQGLQRRGREPCGVRSGHQPLVPHSAAESGASLSGKQAGVLTRYCTAGCSRSAAAASLIAPASSSARVSAARRPKSAQSCSGEQK